MVSLFKESASKLCTLGRLLGDEYVPQNMDPETISNNLVPVAMDIFNDELAYCYFCDNFGTSLSSLAGQVADLMLIEFNCTDPAAIVAAILADLPDKKSIEVKIEKRLGPLCVKVWREIKLFLDPNHCEVFITKNGHKMDNLMETSVSKLYLDVLLTI